MGNKTIAKRRAGAVDPEAAKKLAVWDTGFHVPGLDPDQWRWDAELNLIRFKDYGCYTEHGWEIDYIKDPAHGGGEHFGNLRPLHWRANRSYGGLMRTLLKR
jgi:hypothetical protein